MNMFIGNTEHYEKVTKQRKLLGLDTRGVRQVDIEGSPYLHKLLTDSSGKEYLVEREYKEYSYMGFGWYKSLLLSHNESHRIIIYENINNDDEAILHAILRTKINFNL